MAAVLREVTAAPFANVRVDPAATMSLLQRAAKDQATFGDQLPDAAGAATQRVAPPSRYGAASWRSTRHPGDCDFAIHRITLRCRPTTDNGAHDPGAGDDAERSDEGGAAPLTTAGDDAAMRRSGAINYRRRRCRAQRRGSWRY